jgi:hypothetical protein
VSGYTGNFYRPCCQATPLPAQHASSTLSLEAKDQAHTGRLAAVSDDDKFYRRSARACRRPPCRHSMPQAPTALRPKTRLIRQKPAVGHAAVSGDADKFYQPSVRACRRPPCTHSMPQAPSALRPKTRLIREGLQQCPAMLRNFAAAPYLLAGDPLPCTHSISQAPSPFRPKARLIGKARRSVRRCCEIPPPLCTCLQAAPLPAPHAPSTLSLEAKTQAYPAGACCRACRSVRRRQ